MCLFHIIVELIVVGWILIDSRIVYSSGGYDIERACENGLNNLSKYGPIVRETLYGSNNLVHIFDPDDMETLFRSEGKFPARRSHRALMKYRRDRPHLYSSGGLFPE